MTRLVVGTDVADQAGLLAQRMGTGMGAPDGACILFRPDQHVAARFARFDAARVSAARDRALARETAPALAEAM